MNVTMFLYPISTPDQVDEFYKHSVIQSVNYLTMHNFQIALNILKSQTLSLNDSSLIKLWLPIKDIIEPLFNILKQLLVNNDNNNYFDDQIVIDIIDSMEWMFSLCSPNEIENILAIDNIAEVIDIM